MPGVFSNATDINLFLMIFPHMNLQPSFQYWEYENGLFLATEVKSQPELSAEKAMCHPGLAYDASFPSLSGGCMFYFESKFHWYFCFHFIWIFDRPKNNLLPFR